MESRELVPHRLGVHHESAWHHTMSALILNYQTRTVLRCNRLNMIWDCSNMETGNTGTFSAI